MGGPLGTDTCCDHRGQLRVYKCFPRLDGMGLRSDAAKQTSLGRMGRSRSTTHLAIFIFCLSFLIYAFAPQGSPMTLELGQAGEIARVAVSVAQRGTFANPFAALPTGPTAHVAPTYVFVYASVAKLFGVGRAGAFALWFLNVGFLALQFALL